MKRSKKIVLEAPEGYTFGVSEEDSGELKIKFIPTVATENSRNYANPPIPEGWEYVEGDWYTGFIIQDSKRNQFVWVPVGFLDPNGTLDGSSYSEKFGRRKYGNDEFSDAAYNEELKNELYKQRKSVQKYGGFYISRYNISINEVGEAKSVKGVTSWTKISWCDAIKAAKTFGNGVSVTSHLPYGAEYDSALEWSIKLTRANIARDSIKMASFGWVYDEWTQEKKGHSYRVIRDGLFGHYSDNYNFARLRFCEPYIDFNNTSCRATLLLA